MNRVCRSKTEIESPEQGGETMNRHKWVLVLSSMMCAFALQAGAEVEIEPMRIVPAPDAVAIDGNLADWDLSGWYLAYPSEEVARVQHGWLHAMYDEQHVYLAAEVGDPTPLQNQASLALFPEPWWGDDLEFRFFLDPGDPTTKVEMGIYYSEVAERGEIMGNYYPGGQVTYIPASWTEQSQIAFHKWSDGKGYTMEARVPWLVLRDGFRPVPGSRLTWTMGVLWGIPGNVSNYGLRAKVCGDNDFRSSAGWGTAILEPNGNLNRPKPPLPTLSLIRVVPGAKKLFPIEYTLKKDSTVRV